MAQAPPPLDYVASCAVQVTVVLPTPTNNVPEADLRRKLAQLDVVLENMSSAPWQRQEITDLHKYTYILALYASAREEDGIKAAHLRLRSLITDVRGYIRSR